TVRFIDSECGALWVLEHGEASGAGNVSRSVENLAAERGRELRRFTNIVRLDIRHPIGRNALRAHLGPETEDSGERRAAGRPQRVVVVELLRAPAGEARIEFLRRLGVRSRELVPDELAVHGQRWVEG